MNRFVMDASVTLGWLLPDEGTAEAQRILLMLRASQALVPALWPLEVANAILAAQRRNRLGRAEARQALLAVGDLRIGIEPLQAADMPRVWTLALEQKLSVYDAAYLDLAVRNRIPLATLDRDLRRAAASIGVELLIS